MVGDVADWSSGLSGLLAYFSHPGTIRPEVF